MTQPTDEPGKPAEEAAAPEETSDKPDKPDATPDAKPDRPDAKAWPPPLDEVPTAAPVSSPPGTVRPVSAPPLLPENEPTQAVAVSAYPAGAYVPAVETAPPPTGRKRSLLVSLIVLAVALALCGGGGTAAYFWVQNSEGQGQAQPVEAVNLFLQAVYKNKDVNEAMRYVCPSARDRGELSRRIDDIRADETKLRAPTYTWQTPSVDEQQEDSARLSATVKLTTSDDRTAELKLKFVAVDDDGWWVCEITAG